MRRVVLLSRGQSADTVFFFLLRYQAGNRWLAAFPAAVPASAARVSTVRRAASPPQRLADVTAAVSRRTGNRAHEFAVQMRHHLQSFLTGSVAALAFGYYRVHQDVWYAAEAVRQRR